MDERLIAALVDDLAPVRPRHRLDDILAIAAIMLVEVVLLIVVRPMPDSMAVALANPMFGWKLGATLALALAGTVAAVLALDPVAELKPVRRGLAACAGLIAAVTLLLAGATMDEGGYMPRLMSIDGPECLAGVALFGLPVTLGFVLRARRGAPTALGLTAWAAGVAGAGWGAFLFAWRCPHIDPLYLLVWYGGAIVLSALAARRWLPRFVRW